MGPPAHSGVALAVKPFAPKMPLWVLLLAANLLDIFSMLFIAIGLEQTAVSTTTLADGVTVIEATSVPYSHGLLMSVLFEGSPRLGFGLWCSQGGFLVSIFLEFGFFFGGLALYLRARRKVRDSEALVPDTHKGVE